VQFEKNKSHDKNKHEQERTTQRGLLKPTLQITFFSVLGILVNFVTQIIIAAKFGATMERDAYFAAVVIPGYISAVLLGALTLTFVPVFIEYETKKSKAEAWIVASIFANLTFLVLFAISCIGFIFANQLISVTAPGFKSEELLLTAGLLRIILPSIIFSGLSSLLSSIYYSEHHFLRPAIVSIVNTILMLLFVGLFSDYLGIRSLALGYLVGTVASFLILVPIFFKSGRYHFQFNFRNAGVVQIIRVMSPLVFAGLFYRATTVIERMIASTLPTGSISYLGYANRISVILGGIATLGISTTIFPVMARSWAENDLDKVREYFAKGVRIIMLVTFPMVMVFIVLGEPIIQVVFERGTFDHKATIAVSNALLILMVVLIASGIGGITAKGFYISQKTRLVAILSVIDMVVYLIMAYFLSRIFSYLGLAMASSIQFVFGIIIHFVFIRKIFEGINGTRIMDGFLRILVASLTGAVCMKVTTYLIPPGKDHILNTGIAVMLGVMIYGFVTLELFKLEEAISLKKKAVRAVRTKGIAIREMYFGKSK
jgi:putative peptidoglycan lipid II flippase